MYGRRNRAIYVNNGYYCLQLDSEYLYKEFTSTWYGFVLKRA